MKGLGTGILLMAQVITLAVAQGGDPNKGGQDASLEEVRQRIDQAISAWRKPSKETDRELLTRLVATESKGVPYQCELLDNRGAGSPVSIILEALVRIRQASCVPAIVRLLTSRRQTERLLAADALRGLAFRDCVPPLAQALGDKKYAVRQHIHEALLELSRGSLRLEVLGQVSRHMRESSEPHPFAMLLGHIGGSQATSHLLSLLRKRDARAKLAALQALSKLTADARQIDLRQVIDLLDHPEASVRKEACLLLGAKTYKPAVRDLICLVTDDMSPGVTGNAYWALRRITGLTLKGDSKLWNDWWERSGRKQYEEETH